MKVFILAGGAGTRLWPYSNASLPKQFLHFGSTHSLLQKTFLRFAAYAGEENITIVTQEEYRRTTEDQLKQIGYVARIRSEPERRNTAPAIAWFVKNALEEGFLTKPDLFFVTPSDHYLSNEEELYNALHLGGKKAQEGAICIFGIPPRRAETGYGYIEAQTLEPISSVARFIEKPNEPTAKQLIQSNRIFWNSGMFLFHTAHFLREIAKYAPELDSFLQGELPFTSLTKTSIDYALMEHTADAFVVRLNLTWSDVGSWDGVYEAADKDVHNNVVVGEGVLEKSSNCLICSTAQKVILSGVDDLLVLVSDEEVIVTKRHADVKAIRTTLYSREAQALGNSEACHGNELHLQNDDL